MLIIAASLMMFVQSFIQIIPPIAEKMGSYKYTCNYGHHSKEED